MDSSTSPASIRSRGHSPSNYRTFLIAPADINLERVWVEYSDGETMEKFG